MNKEHFEILLEEMNSKFNLVLEGHESLRNEIQAVRKESNAKHDHTAFLIDTLNKKIDTVDAKLTARIDAVESGLSARIDAVESKLTARIDEVESNLTAKIDSVASDLSAHRADTEAHPKVYCVREE